MAKTDDVDIDPLILDADGRSARDWRRKALGARPEDIVANTASRRHIHVTVPTDGWRLYSAWCKEQDMTPPDHIRAVLVAALAAEGWSEAELRTIRFQSNRHP